MGFDWLIFFVVLLILGVAAAVLLAAFAVTVWVQKYTDSPILHLATFVSVVAFLSAFIAAIKI